MSRHGWFSAPTGNAFLLVSILIAGTDAAFAQTSDVAESSNGQEWSVSSGARYSQGRYGTDRITDVISALNSLTWSDDGVRLSLTLPYLRTNGPGHILVDSSGSPIVLDTSAAPAKGAPSRTSHEGFGDIVLNAAYSVPSGSLGESLSGFDVLLDAYVKLPTGSTGAGLSTGKTDEGGSMDISYSIGDWSPYVDLGYRIRGKPAGYAIENALSASVGVTGPITGKTLLDLSYQFETKNSPFTPDSRQIEAVVVWMVSDRLSVDLFSAAGLSNGAADIEGGLLVNFQLSH